MVFSSIGTLVEIYGTKAPCFTSCFSATKMLSILPEVFRRQIFSCNRASNKDEFNRIVPSELRGITVYFNKESGAIEKTPKRRL
jgi:hypothetical protein